MLGGDVFPGVVFPGVVFPGVVLPGVAFAGVAFAGGVAFLGFAFFTARVERLGLYMRCARWILVVLVRPNLPRLVHLRVRDR